METKTSKVVKLTPNGSFTTAYGELFKFEIHFENGDYGDTNTKELNQKTWEVGKEYAYDIIPNKNPKWNPSIKKNTIATISKTTDESSNKSPNVQRMIVAQSCISSASNFHQKDLQATSKTVLETAGLFYDWAIKKGESI